MSKNIKFLTASSKFIFFKFENGMSNYVSFLHNERIEHNLSYHFDDIMKWHQKDNLKSLSLTWHKLYSDLTKIKRIKTLYLYSSTNNEYSKKIIYNVSYKNIILLSDIYINQSGHWIISFILKKKSTWWRTNWVTWVGHEASIGSYQTFVQIVYNWNKLTLYKKEHIKLNSYHQVYIILKPFILRVPLNIMYIARWYFLSILSCVYPITSFSKEMDVINSQVPFNRPFSKSRIQKQWVSCKIQDKTPKSYTNVYQ